MNPEGTSVPSGSQSSPAQGGIDHRNASEHTVKGVSEDKWRPAVTQQEGLDCTVSHDNNLPW